MIPLALANIEVVRTVTGLHSFPLNIHVLHSLVEVYCLNKWNLQKRKETNKKKKKKKRKKGIKFSSDTAYQNYTQTSARCDSKPPLDLSLSNMNYLML